MIRQMGEIISRAIRGKSFAVKRTSPNTSRQSAHDVADDLNIFRRRPSLTANDFPNGPRYDSPIAGSCPLRGPEGPVNIY